MVGLVLAAVRPMVRRLGYILLDAADLLPGWRGKMAPPRGLTYVGSGDFCAIGDEFLRYFVHLGGLAPGDHVLDIGCGLGRMARPLTAYLDDRGTYEGFDIVPQAIAWCRRHFTTRFPNFRFQTVDVHNGEYHPRGRGNAASLRFLYPDETFDFACAVSVFTHMRVEEVKNYLAEMARVLRSGGRELSTFFLWNEVARRWSAEGKSRFDFSCDMGLYRTTNAHRPEAAIAYKQALVEELHEQASLSIRSIHYGAWSGRPDYLSSQDIIIATKI